MLNIKATNTKCLHTPTEAEPVNPEPPLKTPNHPFRPPTRPSAKLRQTRLPPFDSRRLEVYEPAEASVRGFGAGKGLG